MQQNNQPNPTNRLSVQRISDLTNTPARNGNPKRVGSVNVSAPTLWRWIKQGNFPKPFKLGKNTTVWDTGEVSAWIEEKKGAKK